MKGNAVDVAASSLFLKALLVASAPSASTMFECSEAGITRCLSRCTSAPYTENVMSTIKLTTIAKQLKMSPKVARRKMRDNWPRRPKGGWVFKAEQRKAVVAALKA